MFLFAHRDNGTIWNATCMKKVGEGMEKGRRKVLKLSSYPDHATKVILSQISFKKNMVSDKFCLKNHRWGNHYFCHVHIFKSNLLHVYIPKHIMNTKWRTKLLLNFHFFCRVDRNIRNSVQPRCIYEFLNNFA